MRIKSIDELFAKLETSSQLKTDTRGKPVGTTKRSRRVSYLNELDLNHCRAVLAKNYDKYRGQVLDPITSLASAETALQSITPETILAFPLSLKDCARLAGELVAELRKYNLKPSGKLEQFSTLAVLKPLDEGQDYDNLEEQL